MSEFAAGDALVALLVPAANTLPQSAPALDARRAFHRCIPYLNPAAVTTTTTIAEIGIYTATRKERLIGARFTPNTAVTGAATNFFTLVLGKRAVAALGTLKTLVSYAASTTPAGDIAQWAARDLFAADLNGSAADTDFIMGIGDCITLNVAKAGTGMTFPAGTIEIIVDPRD
jgi:hypothetical protein